MWVSRFEWPSTNLNTVKATIESIMTNLQTHRFNAVIFQVRGQCDTLYPSPYEPWSPILSSSGGTPSGWGTYDPMAHAIQAAHARGLEFHAYINTHVAWQGANTPPANHIWHQHLKASDPSKRDWLIHDSNGNPVQAASDNYVWIAPGVPAAQAYTRKQVMYVVQNYDVDGIHFDRIRMPSPDYSYDPISLARFAGEGNPHGLGFADWTRDQFTRFCCDMYAQIMEVKPHIKVSSAPLGLYRQERYPGYRYINRPGGPARLASLTQAADLMGGPLRLRDTLTVRRSFTLCLEFRNLPRRDAGTSKPVSSRPQALTVPDLRPFICHHLSRR